MHPSLARSAFDGSLLTVVREAADGTGVGGGARVRTLARQEQKELPDGNGEEVEEEKEEKGADFTGAVLSSQQERAPHEKGESGGGRGKLARHWGESGSVWSRRRRALSNVARVSRERPPKPGVAPPRRGAAHR